MPNKYNIPTEEQQDKWEQTVLVPNMINNVVNQIQYYIDESKRMKAYNAILDKRLDEQYKAEQSKKKKMVKDVKGSGIKSKYNKLINNLDQLLNVKTVDQEYDTLMKKADQLVKTKTKSKKSDSKGSGIKSNNANVVQEYVKLISEIDQLLNIKSVEQEYDTLMKKTDQLVKTKQRER
jgi:hypothetical protein